MRCASKVFLPAACPEMGSVWPPGEIFTSEAKILSDDVRNPAKGWSHGLRTELNEAGSHGSAARQTIKTSTRDG